MNNTPPTVNISLLPEEILILIFQQLCRYPNDPILQLIRLAPVCKQWRRVAFDNILWKDIKLDKQPPTLILGISKAGGPAIRALNLKNCKFLIDTTMISILKFCPNLKRIILENCVTLTPSVIVSHLINTQSNLQALSFAYWKLNETHLQSILQKYSQLTFLDVSGCNRITFNCLKKVTPLPPLTTLKINDCSQLVQIIPNIKKYWPNLTSIAVNQSSMFQTNASELVDILISYQDVLTCLEIKGRHQPEVVVEALGKCSKLEKLKGISVFQGFMAYCNSFTTLKALQLTCSLTESEVRLLLTNCQKLEALTFAEIHAKREFLIEIFDTLPSLRSLNLGSSVFKYLQKEKTTIPRYIHKLERLNVGWCHNIPFDLLLHFVPFMSNISYINLGHSIESVYWTQLQIYDDDWEGFLEEAKQSFGFKFGTALKKQFPWVRIDVVLRGREYEISQLL